MAAFCKSVRISENVSYCVLSIDNDPIEVIFNANDDEYKTKKNTIQEAERWIAQHLNKFSDYTE